MNFRKTIILLTFFSVLLTTLFPQNIYLLVFFSILLFGVLPYNKWWDSNTISLLLFSVFYTLMIVVGGQIKSGFLTIAYLITPVSFYRFGHYLIMQYPREKYRINLLLGIGLAYLFGTFLLTFIDISVGGFINENRALLGTSVDDDPLAATLYGLMLSFGLGSVGSFSIHQLTNLQKLGFLSLILLSLLTTVHLINRGGLMILGICSAIVLFFIFRTNFRKGLLISFICLTLGGCFLYFSQIGLDVINAYEYRNEYADFGLDTAGGRTVRWEEAFKNMFLHPLGWSTDRYAHNLWFDMVRVGGWFSLLPFLIVTVASLKNIFFLFRYAKLNLSVLLLSINVALLLAASIEPVIEGSMFFFSLLILIWGMTDEFCREIKRYSNTRKYTRV